MSSLYASKTWLIKIHQKLKKELKALYLISENATRGENPVGVRFQ